jgi:hypothetical protein
MASSAWTVVLVGACASTKSDAPQPCTPYRVEPYQVDYTTKDAHVEVTWHDEWVSRFGRTLPEPLPAPKQWQHPILSAR